MKHFDPWNNMYNPHTHKLSTCDDWWCGNISEWALDALYTTRCVSFYQLYKAQIQICNIVIINLESAWWFPEILISTTFVESTVYRTKQNDFETNLYIVKKGYNTCKIVGAGTNKNTIHNSPTIVPCVKSMQSCLWWFFS